MAWRNIEAASVKVEDVTLVGCQGFSPRSKKLHSRPPYLTLMPWAETRVAKTTVSIKLVL